MSETDEKITDVESQFGGILIDHLHKLSSMRHIIPFIQMMVSGYRASINKEKGEFLEEHGELVETEENIKRYTVPLTQSGQIKTITRRLRRAETASQTLPSTFVVALVSEYDAFLGQLIAEVLRVQPQLLNSSEKNISFSELQTFGDIEEARASVVEKEVETVLRKSHSDQFSWLEKKLGIELRKGLDCWPAFIELTERRNLFVHADGIASSQYFHVCRSNGVSITDDIVLGARLQANREYIHKAYECLYEISSKLAQVIWRKLLPEEMGKADIVLLEATYELLVEKQNRLATNLLTFAVETLKKWDSESNRRMFVINYAQSFYHRGDVEKAADILNREDWTACSDDFKLCELVLRKEYEGAFKLMKSMGKGGPLDERCYMDWPIFRDFRHHDDFPNVYEEVFGHVPVNLAEIERNPNLGNDHTVKSDEKIQ